MDCQITPLVKYRHNKNKTKLRQVFEVTKKATFYICFFNLCKTFPKKRHLKSHFCGICVILFHSLLFNVVYTLKAWWYVVLVKEI